MAQANPIRNSLARFRSDSAGAALVELALGYSLLFFVFAGTFASGYVFLTYNQLQSAVRGAARFASIAPYDHPNGSAWQAQVKNMAVYGQPDYDGAAEPLVQGLGLNNIAVSAEMLDGQPKRVRVAVTNFTLDTIFLTFSLEKPAATFPYIGRVEYP